MYTIKEVLIFEKMRPINKMQISIGVIVLLIGSLVYLIDRSPDQTYFVYSSGFKISLHDTLPNLFGFIGNTLPDFVHVFSFILITAGVVGCQKKGYILICLAWFLVDSAFEWGQGFRMFSSSIIPDWLEGIPILKNTKNYFLYGTFDFFDLASITFGTIVAYFVLLGTVKRRSFKW